MVGGYTPEKVALRRAIALAVHTGPEIRLVRKGDSAQNAVGPAGLRLRPRAQDEMSDHDRRAPGACSTCTVMSDRDGDGWRETPDGQPLVLEYATQPDQAFRQLPSCGKTWQHEGGRPEASSSRSPSPEN